LTAASPAGISGVDHPLEQLVAGERLPKQADRTRLERRSIERDIVAGSDEYDGNPDARGAHARLHIETRQPGHVDVENRTCGPSRGQRGQKSLAGRKRGHLIVGKAQQAAEHGSHGRLVVHDGDQRIGAGHFGTVQTCSGTGN
jgi:hypothetical protein